MVKRFLRSGRTGVYLAVLKEGYVESGDLIELVPTDERAISVADVAALYTADVENRDFRTRLWEADA